MSAKQGLGCPVSHHEIKDTLAQIQVQYREAEKRLQISREDVLRGFLSAYKLAEQQGTAPWAMVAALCEVGEDAGVL